MMEITLLVNGQTVKVKPGGLREVLAELPPGARATVRPWWLKEPIHLPELPAKPHPREEAKA